MVVLPVCVVLSGCVSCILGGRDFQCCVVCFADKIFRVVLSGCVLWCVFCGWDFLCRVVVLCCVVYIIC